MIYFFLELEDIKEKNEKKSKQKHFFGFGVEFQWKT